jgi:hypothetical protein
MSDFFAKLLLTIGASGFVIGILINLGAKWIAKALAPLIAKNPQTAQDWAIIADDSVDYIATLPALQGNVLWDDWLQTLVHKLIEECGLKPSTAKRLATAALWRNDKAPNPPTKDGSTN